MRVFHLFSFVLFSSLKTQTVAANRCKRRRTHGRTFHECVLVLRRTKNRMEDRRCFLWVLKSWWNLNSWFFSTGGRTVRQRILVRARYYLLSGTAFSLMPLCSQWWRLYKDRRKTHRFCFAVVASFLSHLFAYCTCRSFSSGRKEKRNDQGTIQYCRLWRTNDKTFAGLAEGTHTDSTPITVSTLHIYQLHLQRK